ncbi:hypothetical protein MRX96_023433 [Rhipicephalus microplus]
MSSFRCPHVEFEEDCRRPRKDHRYIRQFVWFEIVLTQVKLPLTVHADHLYCKPLAALGQLPPTVYADHLYCKRQAALGQLPLTVHADHLYCKPLASLAPGQKGTIRRSSSTVALLPAAANTRPSRDGQLGQQPANADRRPPASSPPLAPRPASETSTVSAIQYKARHNFLAEATSAAETPK